LSNPPECSQMALRSDGEDHQWRGGGPNGKMLIGSVPDERLVRVTERVCLWLRVLKNSEPTDFVHLSFL